MKKLLGLLLFLSVFIVGQAHAVSYGQLLGGGSEGTSSTYTDFASFPLVVPEGNIATDQSTGDLYVFQGAAWSLIASPSTITTIGAIDGQAKVANGASVVGNTIYLQSSDASFAGLLLATDWTTFNNKEPAITATTSADYYRGDKTMATLDTLAVPENTNLYFTDARAIAAPITGFVSGAGAVAATDTLLQAVNKLDGNTAAKFTLPALTAGSALFSDGSTIAQDNTNFFWDDTNNILKLRNSAYEFGYLDPFTRRAIYAHDTNQVLLLGSWQSDGLPTNSNSEGIIVYGDEALTSTPIGAANGSYARIKAGRFGLFSVESTLPAYAGGQYYFRVDPTSLYLRDNAGAKTFEVTRSSGQIDTALGAGFVQANASGILSSAAPTASQVVNTPAGSISATDVQAALNELDTEKQAAGSYLLANGTTPLTANWNVGAFDITAQSFVGPLTGNASTASALSANPTACPAGEYVSDIAADGTLTCAVPTGTGLSSALTDSFIFVGNASNVATGVAVSGEATIANTGAVTLGNAAVIGKVLTGYVSGSGTVAATDTILQAVQKLNGNTALKQNAFTDIQEVPTGTVDNSNAAFVLSQTPTSSAAVSLYQDGLILVQGVDYTIAGVNITMTTPPNFAQTLYAVYKY